MPDMGWSPGGSLGFQFSFLGCYRLSDKKDFSHIVREARQVRSELVVGQNRKKQGKNSI
jgi:RNase P protein component